ncbi:cupin domain-containing protein [Nocardia sp. BSTN01]|uniref:cupin domain-containing protein n=1 Tax=Nocardia sp. BSTN01 TaxID=2783665 RepID=UPI00188E0CF2|nr:cupin domain-containing protein [Nocardia sp. BSTN01]MBF4999129.1 cupin domain-containing protein [Nocardia sp. BSTN01]
MDDWPDWIHQLPTVDISFPGEGKLLACKHGQVVLWSFPTGAQVPVHSHGPQLGFVVTGSVALTLDDQECVIEAGGHFTIGDRVLHGATVAPGTLVVEIFAEHDRHTAIPTT